MVLSEPDLKKKFLKSPWIDSWAPKKVYLGVQET